MISLVYYIFVAIVKEVIFHPITAYTYGLLISLYMYKIYNFIRHRHINASPVYLPDFYGKTFYRMNFRQKSVLLIVTFCETCLDVIVLSLGSILCIFVIITIVFAFLLWSCQSILRHFYKVPFLSGIPWVLGIKEPEKPIYTPSPRENDSEIRRENIAVDKVLDE
jgi:hypothetical protein